MGKANCPFCNSQDTFNIAYGYLGEKKDKLNYVDQEEIGLHVNYRKHGLLKYDFDGERMSYRSPNRYCKNCGKTFQSRKVMYTVDISTINLIIHTKQNYYRYIFDFSDNDNPKYDLKINWIPIKTNEPLTKDEQFKILSSIKEQKPNLWSGHYGKNYEFDNYYWILKCTYYNGVDYCKSGNDDIPDNWEEFISPFKEIFNNKVFDVCKKVY